MMKRTLALMGACLVLSSCGKKARVIDPAHKRFIYTMTGVIPGLDPHFFQDVTSHQVAGNLYEAPFDYHYLKRPYTLVPNLAESMPTWDKSGKVLRIKFKKGVLFHDDPCFPDGKGRELTVDDVIYSIKRVADMNLNSPNYWFHEGRVVGLAAWRDYTSKNKKPDYSQPVEGLKKIGPYELEIKLTEKDPLYLYALAHTGASSIVPHEAVEKYGDDFKNRAVGTGPFLLKSFGQKSGVLLIRNLKYRDEKYPSEGEKGDQEAGLLAAAGKKIPFLDELEFVVVMEEQPRMLKFQKAETDVAPVNKETFNEMIDAKTLTVKEDFLKKGMKFAWQLSPETWYTAFNLKDPFLGKHKLVRRAIRAAVNMQEISDLVMPGRLQLGCDIIPPGIEGHDQMAACGGKTNPYDLELAKKLLVEAGFPDGKGIPKLTFDLQGSSGMDRQIGEYWKLSLAKIGIELEYILNTWANYLEKEKTGQYQILDAIWSADYPDAENFLLLLSGKHLPPGPNYSTFQNDRYDQLFAEIRTMQPSPARNQRINEMRKIINDNLPISVDRYTRRFSLVQSWVTNYKVNRISHAYYKYLDIDTETMKKYLPMR